MRSWILMLLLALGCGACSESDGPEAEDSPTRPGQTFEPLTDALETAAGVEATLNDAAEARRRQLEEME